MASGSAPSTEAATPRGQGARPEAKMLERTRPSVADPGAGSTAASIAEGGSGNRRAGTGVPKSLPDTSKWLQKPFAFGKKGLWERWYEYPPSPDDDLPDEVRKQIRWSTVGTKTYWYVSKGSLSEIIHNKVKVDAANPPPDDDEVCPPTELESEDEPDAEPGILPVVDIMDVPLVELFG